MVFGDKDFEDVMRKEEVRRREGGIYTFVEDVLSA
jgi:hypothetical protein